MTPNFAFVATHGFIKALGKKDHNLARPELTISNAFHLFVTAKIKEIKNKGGLHKAFKIKNPIMTDSGGFQVFSLGWGKVHKVGKVDKEPTQQQGLSLISDIKESPCWESGVEISSDGVVFNYDGKKYKLTPSKSIAIQEDLGADIIFAFDECTSPLHDYSYNKKSLQKTHAWAKKCLKAKKPSGQLLYGIVQGGIFEDLRRESSKLIGSLPFDGFGVGGSFGEKQMAEVINWAVSSLPESKPRHLLGIGRVKDIFIGVKNGVDTFDCVIPTREARHGAVFSRQGKLDMRKGIFAEDNKIAERGCKCPMCYNVKVKPCQTMKRRDLHRLFKENKPEAQRLATMHNIYFYKNLFAKIRKALATGQKTALNKVEKEYKKLM